MKKWIVALALLVALAFVPALAGEKCSHDADTCLNYLAKHMQGRGWAGVDMDESTMTVTQVFDDTPADKNGVRVGDRLITVNGIELNEANEEALHAVMAEMLPGKTFTYTIERKGRPREVKLTLEAMPAEAIAMFVGKHMLDGHAAVEMAKN
ncbi:MAG: PDZ domain-containing protein [bacterium]|nr:PDZ domain-containing protein [bacterium]